MKKRKRKEVVLREIRNFADRENFVNDFSISGTIQIIKSIPPELFETLDTSFLPLKKLDGRYAGVCILLLGHIFMKITISDNHFISIIDRFGVKRTLCSSEIEEIVAIIERNEVLWYETNKKRNNP